MSIEDVKRAHEMQLMAMIGVEGVGIGDDEIGNPAILIYISNPGIIPQLPKEIEGFPVKVENLGGPIEAYALE